MRIFAYESLALALPVALFVASKYAAGAALGWDSSHYAQLGLDGLNRFAVNFALLFILAQILRRLVYLRDGVAEMPRIGREIYDEYLRPDRVAGFLLVYLLLPHFMATFSTFKQAIPEFQPFAWDRAFYALDRVLHMGDEPWHRLQPFLGKPAITRAFDTAYVWWFPLLFGMAMWMAWSANRRLRMQFFLSFMTLWVFLGTLSAAVFSSAGPCYYAHVTGDPTPYGALTQYLQDVHGQGHVWSVFSQQGLWTAHLDHSRPPLGGISAMPSMHVAAAVLFALTAYRVSALLGFVLSQYAIVILFGSVVLGWHYAVDGYVSIAATLLVWFAVCRMTERWKWLDEPSGADRL